MPTISKKQFKLPKIHKNKKGHFFIIYGKRVFFPPGLSKMALKYIVLKHRRLLKKPKRKPLKKDKIDRLIKDEERTGLRFEPLPKSAAALEAEIFEKAKIAEKLKERELEFMRKLKHKRVSKEDIQNIQNKTEKEKRILEVELAKEKKLGNTANVKKIQNMLHNNEIDAIDADFIPETAASDARELYDDLNENRNERLDDLQEIIKKRTDVSKAVDLDETQESEITYEPKRSDKGSEIEIADHIHWSPTPTKAKTPPPKVKPLKKSLQKYKIRKFPKFKVEPDPTGKGRKTDKKGLSNIEIDQMMSKYPEYKGTIAHNEIESKILPQVKPKSRGCFIINTDPKSKAGEHWQAVYYDARPGGDSEIDFYDSFGDPADNTILKGVKKISDKLQANTYLKFKESLIQKQKNDSSSCGPFCIKFLIDRLNGKPFQHASGYDDHVRGEKDLEKFNKQHGYGAFKYIASFEDEQEGDGFLSDAADKVRNIFGSDKPSNQIVRFLKNNGNDLVQAIRVYRDPINPLISNVLNVATLGQAKQRMNKVGYDKLYHLYSVMQLRNPSTGGVSFWRVEKNSRPESVRLHGFPSRPFKQVPINRPVTLNTLWTNGIRAAGGERGFYHYDHITNNCQRFLMALLKGSGFWNAELQSFILQNVEQLLKNQGLLNKFANIATDVGQAYEKTIDLFTGRGPPKFVMVNGRRRRVKFV